MTCFSSSFGYTSFVPERSNKKGARFCKARETVAFCIAAKSLAKKALPYPLWFAVHQVLRTDAKEVSEHREQTEGGCDASIFNIFRLAQPSVIAYGDASSLAGSI